MVDHLFFELSQPPPAASPAASPAAVGNETTNGESASAIVPTAAPAAAPTAALAPPHEAPSLAELLDARASRAAAAEEAKMAALQAAARGGAVRGDAMLGLMSMKLPPELRARVLDFHPQRSVMPPTICRTPQELFDDFISEELPALRRLGPIVVAPPGSSANVALLIEPRCHPCLEHVIRNTMLLLNGTSSHPLATESAGTWQLQIFHGTANREYLESFLSPEERSRIQWVSLEVDNLSPLAHNELMCTHWLWRRAAAERVLVFQTDALLARDGIDDFQKWDYIGAPWRTDDMWCADKPWLTSVGGNGGLSLRSRGRTLECIDATGYVRGQW